MIRAPASREMQTAVSVCERASGRFEGRSQALVAALLGLPVRFSAQLELLLQPDPPRQACSREGRHRAAFLPLSCFGTQSPHAGNLESCEQSEYARQVAEDSRNHQRYCDRRRTSKWTEGRCFGANFRRAPRPYGRASFAKLGRTVVVPHTFLRCRHMV